MENIARVGIDLAKKVFHVTAVDDTGAMVERRRLRRAGLQSYLASLAAGRKDDPERVCSDPAQSAHEGCSPNIRALTQPSTSPYVKSNKNDVNDADGIAEASSRPSMRFVGLKSVEQQHVQQLHRARQMAVRNRTAQSNQIHGFLLEYGIESPEGTRCCRGWRRCLRTRRTSSHARVARCCGGWATS